MVQGGNVDPRYDKAFPVSWEQFHRDARALTWRLDEHGPFHAVVAITPADRGSPVIRAISPKNSPGPR